MKTVLLAGLPIKTSRLGFGCAALTAVDGRRDALRILECALEAGVQHFDVARVYGLGVAESILGEFLRGRREQVTVTTKFGLNPPALIGRHQALAHFGKRLLRKLPRLDQLVRNRLHHRVQEGAFDVESARQSLETSLREMHTDYLDIWLLHEAEINEANNFELLEFLADRQKAGVIRAYGIGSDIRKLEADGAALHASYGVVQIENSIVFPMRPQLGKLEQRALITHGAMRHLPLLRERLLKNRDFIMQVKSETDIDLSARESLATAMLTWALDENPDGVVLFNSSVPENIRANARTAENSEKYLSVARRLRQWFLQEEVEAAEV